MTDMPARVQQLGNNTARILTDLWQQHLDGDLTRAELVDLVLVIIRLAHEQGRLAAEAAFTLWAIEHGLDPDPALQPPAAAYADPDERMTSALQTIIEESDTNEERQMRIERLGRGEATAAAHSAFAAAISAHPMVKGWIRRAEPGACQICRNLAAAGPVRNTAIRMYRHPGCSCVPIPLTD